MHKVSRGVADRRFPGRGRRPVMKVPADRRGVVRVSTVPVGSSRNLVLNTETFAPGGLATTCALFVDGSYSKNVVGAGNLQGGAGLPASSTLPLGSSTPGASIGKLVLPALSLRVGPAVHADAAGRAGS